MTVLHGHTKGIYTVLVQVLLLLGLDSEETGERCAPNFLKSHIVFWRRIKIIWRFKSLGCQAVAVVKDVQNNRATAIYGGRAVQKRRFYLACFIRKTKALQSFEKLVIYQPTIRYVPNIWIFSNTAMRRPNQAHILKIKIWSYESNAVSSNNYLPSSLQGAQSS